VLCRWLSQLCRDIRSGLPPLGERISKGPAKPWEQRLTVLQVIPQPQPSYLSCQNNWAHLPDPVLQAALQAARAAIPAPVVLQRQQAIGHMAAWFDVQEAVLAWAVVKYGELVSVCRTTVLFRFRYMGRCLHAVASV
jgi:hypothetical protein